MILNPYTITNEQLIMVIENHLKAELSVKYLAEYFGTGITLHKTYGVWRYLFNRSVQLSGEVISKCN